MTAEYFDLLGTEGLRILGDLFKSMGEPSRLKILDHLSYGEHCVNELAELTELSQSLVSHHLRLLRNIGVVKAHRQGRQVYYSLDDDHILNIFLQGKDHIKHMHLNEDE
ncbi:MAG: metalloregulator ArsR/SmtB family transcription factor [Tissierellia bacterium]|nr:metalloregulator ArsR/SmtB family transcription factor [Tissierellia bacterium]